MARRRAHLDDYEPSGDGGYTYRGSIWHWGDAEARRRFLRALAVLLAVTGCALVGAGFIPLGSSASFLMLLPYALACVLTAVSASRAWRLAREGDAIRDHVYESTVERLKPLLAFAATGAFAGAVGALLTTFLMAGDPTVTLPFCALMLAAGIALSQAYRRLMSLTFTKA